MYVYRLSGQTDFFEVGGITMQKCTSYGPDKLFYHLTFKCDLHLQPTRMALSFSNTTTVQKLFEIHA